MALVQERHIFSSTTTASQSFVSTTVNHDFLICVILAGAYSPLNSFDCGTLSVVSVTTAGISWIPAGAEQFVFNYTNPANSQGIFGVAAVYYVPDAPSITSGTPTVVTLAHSGGASASLQTEISIMEVSGLDPTAAVASVAVQNFVGSPTGTYPYATTSMPTAGSVAAGGGQSFALAAFQSQVGFGGAGPGWTQIFAGTNDCIQYREQSAPTSLDTTFGLGAAMAWAAIGVVFGLTGIVTGGGTSCGDCPGPHLLQLIPGFSDLPDSVLQTDDPAFALHVGEIAFNATFGMVRCETFACTYKHGDTVPLPTSCWDGYQYSREELTYIWAVQSSCDPSTNWISGPDALWFMNWNVVQTTGEVFCEEWYERSSTADSRLAAKSNDGLLMIFTIAQRQKTNMIMGTAASYTAISESTIATDKPYTQDLAQHLNQNAKFSCVNSEVFYLGEYTNAQTVKLPISPVDGYVYSAAECQFQHAWRWTAASGTYVQPPGNLEQAAPFQASINGSGVVSISVSFSTSGGENVTTPGGYGRIAAFAFCTRSTTPSSGTLANAFTELGLDFFAPGRTVRASEVLTIKRNIDEAILSPEFFGPTDYHDAATVTLPVSPVDGYIYSRSEVQYIWSWSDVKNNSGGTHVRLPLFLGSIDPASGVVKLRCWRLPPGGPYVDDSNVNALVRVVVMATRQAIHPGLTLVATDATTPADAGTFITDTSNDLINGT